MIRCADLIAQVYPTLRSVEHQEGGPGDIVLVADASTPDRAKEWLDRLAATRGHAFLDVPSDLPGVVRNRGVRAAVGPYVMSLDAGERLDPAFHATCRAAFESDAGNKSTNDVHVVTTSVLMLGPGTERRIVPDRPIDLDDLIGDTTLAHSASVFRRETWDQLGGFDETLSALDDYELFLRILNDGRRGTFIDSPLLIRTWRADALYQRAWESEPRLDSFRTILEKHAERFAENPVAALVPRERRLHRTAGRYRELVARHDDARAEMERLTTEASKLRSHLPPDLRDTVTFDDLRRTSPIARDWGYERGKPIDRYYIEDFIKQNAADIAGAMLEVQEPDYTERFGGERVTHTDVIDLNADNPRATLIGDLRCAPHLPSETYDCLIITQTLHVVDDMRAVIAECERTLKPGGVLLATLPCASRVCLEYGYGGDPWRVTVDGARHLFAEVFPGATLGVEGRANVLVTTAFLYGLGCHELRESEFALDDPYNPTLVTVRAVKAARAMASGQDDTGNTKPPARRSLPASPPARGPASSGHAAILLYHAVGTRDIDPHGLSVPVDAFRKQVTYLRDRYQVMSLDDLSQTIAANVVPDGTIVLTFDDGYLDSYTTVSPILADLGLPATFFLTTDRLDQSEHHEFWWDALADSLLNPELRHPSELRLNLPEGDRVFGTATGSERLEAHTAIYRLANESPPDLRDEMVEAIGRWSGRREASGPTPCRMNAAELIELAGRPGHAVGAHTVRHLMLPRQSRAVQYAECAESRSSLEHLIGAPVTAFAYPFGAFDDTTEETVRSAGFQVAVTCEDGRVSRTSDPLRLPRLEVTPHLTQPFEAWLGGHLSPSEV